MHALISKAAFAATILVLMMIRCCDGLQPTPISNAKFFQEIIQRHTRTVSAAVVGITAGSHIRAAFALTGPKEVKRKAIAAKAVESLLLKSNSYLGRRASSMDSLEYKTGVSSDDVYYPIDFQGKWNVSSIFREVTAPLGVEVFGGQPVFDAALKDVNSSLNYVAKFKPGPNDTTICDRLYNVEQIAEASMGLNSILNDAQLDDNLARRLRLTISPPSSKGAIFDIELLTTDREYCAHNQSSSSSSPYFSWFEAMERTSQIIRVRSDKDGPDTLPLRKNIETITLYTFIDKDTIQAIQRTATFLSPLDPRYSVAVSRNPDVYNTAVDIRRYDVFYRRI
eukprot:gene1438-2768_t